MQVVHRKRRVAESRKPVEKNTVASSSKIQSGSRFSIIEVDNVVPQMNNSMDIHVPITVAHGDLQGNIQKELQVENDVGLTGNLSVVVSSVPTTQVECSVGLSHDTSPVQKPSHEGNPTVSLETHVVACMNAVIPLDSSLSREKHTIVQVVVNGENPVLREKNGRVLPSSIRDLSSKVTSKVSMGWRCVQKSSLKLKRRDAQEPSNATLARRMSALESKLNATQTKVASSVPDDPQPLPTAGSNVHWML
ncbi:hypothetical protein V6N13_096047 [Hibiscus sabdariffa]